MLYEIHMLKNYPATNLNRDESGAPKTCEFGGALRGRISSQCLKRSWRSSQMFSELVGAENIGSRTRKLPELVGDILRSRGVSEEYISAVVPKISGFANKEGTENKKDPTITSQIAFYSNEDIEAVADCVMSELEKCKTVKDVEKLKAKEMQKNIKDVNTRPITLDIALFGRMVTSNSFRDVEASMQVAHAVSTNRVVLESDFFTAVDDLLDGSTMEESGGGMIGDIDYNSSCYYIYASIDSDALAKNLDYAENAEELTRNAIKALVRTMAYTNPSAKQNSFAGNVLPSAILIECKDKKIPVSYVNAYVEPAANKNLVKNSIQKLVDECDMISTEFEIPVVKRLWFCADKYEVNAPKESIRCEKFSQLINGIEETFN